ncbi:hypothetical protein NDU88_004236 [Pleurodeles waltl]|uniref:Uncharacterized protein n=1 Tax=Pleurodeles waltl TaxID=8319 RepID=A0AAV7NLP5_PLEWA|nr:hypothetical protein NDU88_004236 [Pleurodeles waltl]
MSSIPCALSLVLFPRRPQKPNYKAALSAVRATKQWTGRLCQRPEHPFRWTPVLSCRMKVSARIPTQLDHLKMSRGLENTLYSSNLDGACRLGARRRLPSRAASREGGMRYTVFAAGGMSGMRAPHILEGLVLESLFCASLRQKRHTGHLRVGGE